MILVYCEHITSRHEFAFGFFLGDVVGIPHRATVDIEEYMAWQGPKFSYAKEATAGPLHFRPYGLLSETGIKSQHIRIDRWNSLPVFFSVDGPSALPFDPFALSFYLVSRYEEYLPHDTDMHGRFTARSSLAYREGFLDIPLVNMIGSQFRDLLREKFPQEVFPEPSYTFIPTFDIDIAYAHLGKGMPRAAAAWARLLLTTNFPEIRERWSAVTGRIKDPYDNFDLHMELAREGGLDLRYFALLGDFGGHDRNLSHRNRRFRALLQKLNLSATIGIHPSYRSFLDPLRLRAEIGRLEEITGKPVTSSRFHFLRMKFPDSYRSLIEAGITDDFSMGYSSINGFRASTSTPHFFFDLHRNEKTNLKVHPFIFMDSAMIDNLKLNPAQGLEEIYRLLSQVKTYGGEAIGVWHNYSLSEKGPYRGWRGVLQQVLLTSRKD